MLRDRRSKPWHLAAGATMLAIAATVATGCGGAVIVVNGIEVYERVWRRASADVTQRAAFDLQCPANMLELTLIAKSVREPTTIGVRGCGRQGTYVRPVVGGAISPQWLLQAAVQ